VLDWLFTEAGWLLSIPEGGGMNTVFVFCGVTPAYMLLGSEGVSVEELTTEAQESVSEVLHVVVPGHTP
jgi:hypothetical protein